MIVIMIQYNITTFRFVSLFFNVTFIWKLLLIIIKCHIIIQNLDLFNLFGKTNHAAYRY